MIIPRNFVETGLVIRHNEKTYKYNANFRRIQIFVSRELRKMKEPGYHFSRVRERKIIKDILSNKSNVPSEQVGRMGFLIIPVLFSKIKDQCN